LAHRMRSDLVTSRNGLSACEKGSCNHSGSTTGPLEVKSNPWAYWILMETSRRAKKLASRRTVNPAKRVCGVLSHDGKTVTFIVRDTDGDHFASVHADGTGYREVPAPLMLSGGYTWTADNRSFLFVQNQNEKSRFCRRISSYERN
jgi:hypothetical protein